MSKETVVEIGSMRVRQYFDQASNSWLTSVCDANGTEVGSVEYCDYGDKQAKRTQLNACKKRARDLQGISGARGASSLV